MVEVGEGTGGGMMQTKVPDARSQWIPFIAVADVVATTERIVALGGGIVKGPAEVPGYGWYSVVTDPTGAAFGIWDRERR
jgi:predicted enzyme related to lactoylglutathione lyase